MKDLATYAQLVEKLRTERPESSITGAFNAAQELKQLLLVNSSSLLEDRKLNTQALTELLTQAARIYQADMEGIGKEELEVWGDNKNAWTIGSIATLTEGIWLELCPEMQKGCCLIWAPSARFRKIMAMYLIYGRAWMEPVLSR